MFDAEESLSWAKQALEAHKYRDAQYHCYNSAVRACKALLTTKQTKTNSHASIIDGFDSHFPEFKNHFGTSFQSVLDKYKTADCTEVILLEYFHWANTILKWIKKTALINE